MHIQPYADNSKLHPDKQVQLIANSIKRFGWQQPIVVDRKNIIIVGHGRYAAFQKYGEGMDEPWITDNEGNTLSGKQGRELTDKEVKAYRLADNKLNESDWDLELVIEELKDIDDPALQELTGFDMDLLLEPEEADDAVPDIPDEPKSKLGDLYQLGPHRVLCGDSTNLEDVERLMDGRKADMVFTDPPYGMNLKPVKNYASAKENKKREEYTPIIGDQTKFDADIIFQVEAPVYYIWGADYFPDTLKRWDEGNLIIWTKRMSENESEKVFGSAFEVCWTYPKQKKVVWFERGINQSSEALGEHPTQKPTGLAVRAFNKSSKEGDLVVDLFLGSGSTLIAAEKTGRICYGLELDCRYVDVIVQRYIDYVDNPTVILNNEDVTHLWQKTVDKTVE